MLISIETICLALEIVNKGLIELGIWALNQSANDVYDCDLQHETHFNVNNLDTFVETLVTNLPSWL